MVEHRGCKRARAIWHPGSLLSQEGDIGINPGENSLIFDLNQQHPDEMLDYYEN